MRGRRIVTGLFVVSIPILIALTIILASAIAAR